ncbi:MAG: Metallo-beta-lactamase family protein [Candidatus Collierbacteria bacterium GW2011_GWA1_45_15]|nr:MAG: Metallo-beta-lactamase family protein [Candidatus Collierbacteria bacterium GW2011_GWA1_45_15]
MEIITLTVGDLATNCYLVTDEDTGETLIIDPGDEGDFISTTLLEKKLIPQAIILTHGHYDHCLACLELKLNFNIPIYLHQADLFLYQKAHLSAPFWSNKTPHRVIPGLTRNPGLLTLPPIDHFLTDNQTITFGNSLLQVLHTPGHTPGSCSFLISPVKGRNGKAERGSGLFTGDTLFAHGVGRTDHSYSSPSDLQKSLSKLRTITLEHKTPLLIYPGHEDFGFSRAILNSP